MSASILAADTDQWARSVTDNFISLSVHSTETRFQGVLDVARLGDGMTVSRVQNTPATVSRTRKGARSDLSDDVLILTPLQGSLVVVQGEHRQRVGVGMASVHVAEQPYDLVFDAPGNVLVLQAPRTFAPASMLTMQARAAAAARARPLVSVFRAFLEEAHAVIDQLSSSEAESVRQTASSLAAAVLAAGLGEGRAADGRALAVRAQAYIRAHVGDADLDPGRVAARFHVSVRLLQSAFRDLGISPAQYIRTVRLARARELLQDPRMRGLSISAVAAMVGCEESTFYRAYRAAYGCAPGEDRNRVKNPPTPEAWASAAPPHLQQNGHTSR